MAIKRVTLLAVLIALNGLLFGAVVCVGNNNIFNDHNWVDYKANLQLGLGHARSALVGRWILKGANMHLGAYLGYQTIISRHTERIDRLDLKFKLGSKAYLDAVVGGTPSLALGVRFSGTSAKPGQIYKLRSDGKFVTHSKKASLDLTSGWHLGSFRQNGPNIDVWIDSKKILTIINETLQPQFELRGNSAEILISSVIASFKNRVVWQDHFFFPTSWKIIFKGCLGVAAAVSLALFLISFIFLRQLPVCIQFTNRTLGLILLFQALWLSFDFFYYTSTPVVSPNWVSEAYQPTIKYLNFERFRGQFFSTLGKSLGADTAFTIEKSEQLGYLHQRLDYHLYTICRDGRCLAADELSNIAPKKSGEIRILIIGGSEFQGAGSFSTDGKFVSELYYNVQPKVSSPVQIFDIALWSDSPRQQVTSTIKLFDTVEPDVVIAGFTSSLTLPLQTRRLLRFLSTKDTKAVFVTAPADFTKRCHSCYKTIKKTYLDFGQEFIQLKKLLFSTNLEQSGFLWMDARHMTKYGNSLLADIVASTVLKNLKTRPFGKLHGRALRRKDGSRQKRIDIHER